MVHSPTLNVKRAFSLVELSIVLVILGLLVGGVLSGQSLIHASELRAVTNEYQRYTAAIGTFRDKYFALPGDMANATSFWTTAAACPGISTTAVGGTCNGDGNGQILQNAATANELFRFWQHLALAGMVEGNYTGTSGDTTAANLTSIVGSNVPRSKLNSGGWSAFYLGVVPVTSTQWFDGNYGNVLFIGSAVASSYTTGPLFKPEDAWNLDTKMDDGKPATGGIVTMENEGGAAATSCSDQAASAAASLATSNYFLANTGLNCTLVFKSGY